MLAASGPALIPGARSLLSGFPVTLLHEDGSRSRAEAEAEAEAGAAARLPGGATPAGLRN